MKRLSLCFVKKNSFKQSVAIGKNDCLLNGLGKIGSVVLHLQFLQLRASIRKERLRDVKRKEERWNLSAASGKVEEE